VALPVRSLSKLRVPWSASSGPVPRAGAAIAASSADGTGMGASVGAAASLFASTGPAPVGPPRVTEEVGDGAGDRRGVSLRTESPMPTTGSRRIAWGDADRPDVRVRACCHSAAPSVSRYRSVDSSRR
jgi:hypothetical protein